MTSANDMLSSSQVTKGVCMTVVTGLPIAYTVSQPVSLWAASRFESLSKNPMLLEENLPGS